jgi:hypothetical protein
VTDLRIQLQSTLGNGYTLERELGGGGMSRVFVARENALGREVAGAGLFAALFEALGVPGVTGLDRLLGFAAEREVVALLRGFAGELSAGAGDLLMRLGEEVQPVSAAAASVAVATQRCTS